MSKSSRRRLANPLLPVASSGARSITGPSSNSRTTQWHCVDRGAIAAPAVAQSPLLGHEGRRLRAARSPSLHHFIGHEEDSNPRRSDRRTRDAVASSYETRSAICVAAGAANTRGSTEVPDHFKFRQSVGSDARRWYRRETGATTVGGSFCPVAQERARPALTREVDGANPSGAAIFRKSKRTSAPPPGGSRPELQPQLVEHAH